MLIPVGDYSKLRSFSGADKTLRYYIDYCILTLRMVLTCLGDVTPAARAIDIIKRQSSGKGFCRASAASIQGRWDHSRRCAGARLLQICVVISVEEGLLGALW